MTTIAHISDLHFGAEHPEVVEGLVRDLEEVAPDLAVVSGDAATVKRSVDPDKVPGASRQPLFAPVAGAPYAHPFYWAPFILIGNGK